MSAVTEAIADIAEAWSLEVRSMETAGHGTEPEAVHLREAVDHLRMAALHRAATEAPPGALEGVLADREDKATLHCLRCGNPVLFDRKDLPRRGILLACHSCSPPDQVRPGPRYSIRVEVGRQLPDEAVGEVLATIPATAVDFPTLLDAMPVLRDSLAEAWAQFEGMAPVADADVWARTGKVAPAEEAPEDPHASRKLIVP